MAGENMGGSSSSVPGIPLGQGSTYQVPLTYLVSYYRFERSTGTLPCLMHYARHTDANFCPWTFFTVDDNTTWKQRKADVALGKISEFVY